jgi:hypothetical protein
VAFPTLEKPARAVGQSRISIPLLSDALLLQAADYHGSVTGRVSSRSTRRPIPAAEVVVGGRRAVTDGAGNFALDDLDTGAACVAVTAEGFSPYRSALKVGPGENTLKVVLADGTVSGLLLENAEVREPITGALVTIAGQRATTMRGACFKVAEAPIGPQIAVVTAPGHALCRQEVVLTPGANRVEIILDLTPVETYRRYHAAYRFRRWREVHRFVHPDVKRHESYKAFVKGMERDVAVCSFEILDSRPLGEWRSTWMQKTYNAVVAIDRVVRYSDVNGDCADHCHTQHWQQIDGRWFIIYD